MKNLNNSAKKRIESLTGNITQISMQVFGSSETLSLIRRVISACVQNLNLNATLLNDIKLATTEACTNVIKHAYKFDDTKCFDLMIKVNKELFFAEVLYEDPDFDPEEIPVPDLTEIKEGGLGVFIIRNIMDSVKYETDHETGKVRLKMAKNLAAKTTTGGQNED